MSALREFLDRQRAAYFDPGRPLEKLRPLYQAVDDAMYTPGTVTRTAPHIRDGANAQRVTAIVLAALAPIILWGMYNTGHKAATASENGAALLDIWQCRAFSDFGWNHDSTSIMGCSLFGALMYLPVACAAIAIAGATEVLLAILHRRALRGNFLVDALIFSLILPPSAPLWIVALSMSVGCILTHRGRLGIRRWNHPAIPGWILANIMFESSFPYRLGPHVQFIDHSFESFVDGWVVIAPLLIYLLCAAGLAVTGVRSWRPMATFAVTAAVLGVLFKVMNPDFNLISVWADMATGTIAFVAIFIATDPTSSPFTNRGRLLYGLDYVILVALSENLSPGGGSLIAIFLASALAPGLDELVIRSNVRRRQARYAQKQ